MNAIEVTFEAAAQALTGDVIKSGEVTEERLLEVEKKVWDLFQDEDLVLAVGQTVLLRLLARGVRAFRANEQGAADGSG